MGCMTRANSLFTHSTLFTLPNTVHTFHTQDHGHGVHDARELAATLHVDVDDVRPLKPLPRAAAHVGLPRIRLIYT
jgi:hypothetical protein